jgi:hypothetical protein
VHAWLRQKIGLFGARECLAKKKFSEKQARSAHGPRPSIRGAFPPELIFNSIETTTIIRRRSH